MGRTWRCAALSAVAFGLAWAPSGAAEDDEEGAPGAVDQASAEAALRKYVPLVIDTFKDADEDRLKELVARVPEKALSLAPKALFEVSTGTARYGPRLCRAAAASSSNFARKLKEAGEKAVATWPDDAAAQRALAAAIGANVRMDVAQGESVGAEPLQRIADLIGKSYARAGGDGGLAARHAMRWLRQAALGPKTDAACLPGLMEAMLGKVQETIPSGPAIDAAKAEMRLAQAQVVVRTQKGSAKGPLDECIALVDGLLAGTAEDTLLQTLHAEVLSTARAAKVSVKSDYRVVSRNSGAGKLEFTHPTGDHWKSEGGDGDRSLHEIYQWDARGRFVRHISLNFYSWNKNYTDEEGIAGGDNLKGLARQDQRLRRDDFGSVTKEKELAKGNLNAKMPGAQSYEIIGTDRQGNYLRNRVWYVKGKEAPLTFEIAFEEFEDIGKLDPEVEAFLSSLQEVKKK